MPYPSGLDSFTTKVDGQDDILAAHMNAVQTAVLAIETELGLLPKGSATDLVTRLAVAHNNDGTLKTAAIVPGALSILLSMLAANSVDSSKIVDASITGADIAAATITGSNIAAGTIGSGNIANLAIITALLADTSVTGAKASAQMSVRRAQAWLGTIPTTGSVECYIMVPANSVVQGLKLISKDALLGSDTNYVTVVGTDVGSNGVGSAVVTNADATDTTKATGGTNGVVALASTNFGVNGATVAGNDVIKLVFTVSGTLPNTLTNCQVSMTFGITT